MFLQSGRSSDGKCGEYGEFGKYGDTVNMGDKGKMESTKKTEMNEKIQIEAVKTEGFTMEYCRFGKGKRTFVIIPGLSVQSVMPLVDIIADAYRELTEDFTVYVFDRRKDLPEVYRIEDAARDTAEAMEKLGLEDADLFGASQGGMIVMKIAMDHPELVHKLVVGSSSPVISDGLFNRFEEWIRLAELGDAEKLYLSFGEMVYPKEVFEQARVMLVNTAATVTKEDLSRFLTLLNGMHGLDLSGDLGRISCPVLVLGSEDDRVLGVEGSKQIYDGLTDQAESELYLYNGYGHAAYDCAPDYKTRIHRFLCRN